MSNNSRASKKRAVANTDRIVKMYQNGSNIVQISGEMGLFRRNVKAILISEGVLKKEVDYLRVIPVVLFAHF